MSGNQNSKMIRIERMHDKVGIVYLDNPPLNVITLKMTESIFTLFSELEYDNSVKVVVITGAGEKAFCAGADIKEFAAVRDDVVEKKLKKENEAFRKIEDLSKPVIAAIDSVALGGGCELALACDIRVMSKSSRIGLPEVKLGVFPGTGGVYRLPRIVGLSRAMEMMYTGDFLSAEEAYRIGLVNHLAEPGQALSVAKNIAGKLAQQPRESLASIKLGVRKSVEMNLDDAISLNLELSDRVFKTPDCEEGVKAFFEKRDPYFN